MLSSDIDGHLDVKLEFHHFEGCCVPVSKEISNKSAVSSRGFSPISIRDSGGLYDGRIHIFPRHVVNEANKSVIQDIFLHVILNMHSFP